MHNISTDMKMPSISEVVDVLTAHTNKFGVPLDYDRMLEYQAYFTMKGTAIKKRIIKYTGSTRSVDDYGDADFLQFITNVGVSTGLQLTQKGNKISMGKDSLGAAIATGLYSDELNKLMELYIEQGRCFKAISSFKKIFENHPIASIETFDNHRMIITKPTWVPQNTGRIGAQNPGLMNISKDVHDIFTVPKGYVYLEVDSGQIEPRLIQSAYINDPQLKKCTMMYNDAYYGYVHYCRYLTDEQRRSGTLDLQPVPVTPEMEALRKKFKTFGNATMYGSTENRLNDPDKAAFIKYIGGHPNRVKWQKRVEDQIDRGQKIFYTIFGTPIDVTAGGEDDKYPDKESDAYFAHLVRTAINNPIQGTAADLMRYSVLQADKLISTEAPNSFILQYVHDAGKFAISEYEYDRVKDRIHEITAYQVDTWIPIYSGVEEGVIPSKDVKRFIV